jgi:hypothetical protein
MDRTNWRKSWLPLAIAGAIAITNPFLMIVAGMALGLLILFCESRPRWRQLGGAALFPLAAFALWYNPLLALFAASSSFVAVFSLRRNLFSSVTSSALIGCATGTLITAMAIGSGGGASWAELEKNVLESQQSLQQMTAESAAGDVEQEIAWQEMNRLVVRLIPGQFALIMVAGFFLAMVLFRRFCRTGFHLSPVINTFTQYRFEDNWVWVVVAGLAGSVLASGNETITRLALNLLFVMGVLYVIRGLSVMFHFLQQRKGGLLLKILVIMLCFTPMILVHLVLGLLDTWIDFRRSVPQA